ncbi:MauE/DoxX family redox-associated membrane protein [Alcaligenes sp. SDU_A2]|uniref:MauE/DoxX family redox-associated membrane protein n=1 Tax=Alcaligenes sp. SDU_A2 TaxID=3136634 RepID=UPI00311F220B
MDPILAYASVACLAVLMGLGALDKLRHFSLFEAAVGGYRLLPEVLLRPFSLVFVAGEALAAPLLLWPGSRQAGAALALAVLAVATLGIVLNLLQGRRDVDCGCSGLGESSAGLSWWLVGRNTLLAMLAVAGSGWLAQSARELTWMDGLTFFGATLALLGLYHAANQLIESHLKFQKIQNS